MAAFLKRGSERLLRVPVTHEFSLSTAAVMVFTWGSESTDALHPLSCESAGVDTFYTQYLLYLD